MKKIFSLLLAAFLVLSLTACAAEMLSVSTPAASTPDASAPAATPLNISTFFHEPTSLSIDVDSLAELETMRTMSVSSDTEAVQAYLHDMRGSGTKTQADLVNFLRLYDALPKLNLLDGEISWISLSMDEEKGSAHFFISVMAPNGDWVRTEYNLTTTDVNAEIEKLEASESAANLLDTPFSAVNGRVMLYWQECRTYNDTPGSTMIWRMTLDGIYGFIFYHSESSENIVASEVFADASVSNQ